LDKIVKQIFGSADDKILRKQLKQILRFTPGNLNLYKQALRHNTVSESIREDGFRNSNERLEYLGDAILNCVVAEMVFLKYPYRGEGFLTQMRSKIVSRSSLNILARKVGLDKLVQLDKRNFAHPNGMEMAFGNAMEALIGAVFLDSDHDKARKFILKTLVANHIDVEFLEQNDHNFKSRIYEWAQREGKVVRFDETEVVQNGKHKLRRMVVMVDDQEMGMGLDHVKKKAEQQAAEKACAALGV
jgi:ribonuclease-3